MPPNNQEQFMQAAADWNLEQLYTNLSQAKKSLRIRAEKEGIFRNSSMSNNDELTNAEQRYLRGLLCGNSPTAMATILGLKKRSLAVILSNTIYRYVKELTRPTRELENWRDIVQWLRAAGYRRPAEENAENMDVSSEPKINWGFAPAATKFYGRTDELNVLRQWIVDDRCNIVGLSGMAGIGKTSLSIKVAQQIQHGFKYVIWRSLRNTPPLEELLTELISFVSNQQEIVLPESLEQQVSLLLHYLQQQRCLILVDNVDSIIQAGVYAGIYLPGHEGYGYLFERLGRIEHQSCLFLTSREKQKEITLLEGDVARVRSLHLGGLNRFAGQELFKSKGCYAARDEELQEVSEHYDGNPLSLKMVASAVQELVEGDMTVVLPQLKQGRFQFDDINWINAQTVKAWCSSTEIRKPGELVRLRSRQLTNGKHKVDDSFNPPFYIDRVSDESKCYRALLEPGALIRIRGPQQIGKTWLIEKLFEKFPSRDYRTASLSFKLADSRSHFTDLDKFLRWFCQNISLQLGFSAPVVEYWDEAGLGSKVSCTIFFEEYLLKHEETPLVLCLDDVDWIFPYPEIYEDFFALLRSWHEKGKSRRAHWGKFRLAIVHSTEAYIRLSINQSPFNVGIPIELTEFNHQQVQELAHQYGFNWDDTEVEQLMYMIGGYPLLVQQTLTHLRTQPGYTLDKLLETASQELGIYSNHLRSHLLNLQQHPALAAAFKTVVTENTSVPLETMQIYQLYSMGLITLQGNEVKPRCHLYRQYFRDRLGDMV